VLLLLLLAGYPVFVLLAGCPEAEEEAEAAEAAAEEEEVVEAEAAGEEVGEAEAAGEEV